MLFQNFEFSKRLRVTVGRFLQMVANQEAHEGGVADVVSEIRDGDLADVDRRLTAGDRGIVKIRRQESSAAGGFDQPASVVRERVALVSGGNVSDDGDAGTLEPKAVALVAEILEGRFAAVVRLARAGGANRHVAVEAADFVADFGGKRGTVHVVGHVLTHVDVAAVVNESPAGAVDHGAALDNGGIAVLGESVAMEVDRIPGALVGARARLQLPIGATTESLTIWSLSVRPSL